MQSSALQVVATDLPGVGVAPNYPIPKILSPTPALLDWILLRSVEGVSWEMWQELMKQGTFINAEQGTVPMMSGEFESHSSPYQQMGEQGILDALVEDAIRRIGHGSAFASPFFDWRGQANSTIRQNASGWKSLHQIYFYEVQKVPSFGAQCDDFWVGMMNAQAVRNRLRIVTRLIGDLLTEMSQYELPVRVASLACGSAPAVLSGIVQTAEEIPVSVYLSDYDPTAVEYIKETAEILGISDSVCAETRDISHAVVKKLRLQKPNIVEMVGYLDYLDDERAIRLFKLILEAMVSNGVFVTANIMENVERRFLHTVINWPKMVYRTPEQVANLMIEAGFDDVRLQVEPHHIHVVVWGRKPQRE